MEGILMDNGIISIQRPYNEPTFSYAPGSAERKAVMEKITELKNTVLEIPLIIGGKEIKTGSLGECRMPHDHKHKLAVYHKAGAQEVKYAIEEALKAKKTWESINWEERAFIFQKAADLLSGPYRATVNAATMLCQSKNVFQAEIDSACELIDFFRFNAFYMQQIYREQPFSAPGTFNRLEYRPLEGFIYAVTPFNFTSIGGNLPSAPAIMGNTVIWKPAQTAVYSNYFIMKLFMEAGLPAGVINFVPGNSSMISEIVFSERDFAGVHFTGSTEVFNGMYRKIGENIDKYRTYPRIVGETGGKDFIFVHESADADSVATALVRGAFEYQGQKCSAASRAYIPQNLWEKIKIKLIQQVRDISTGSPEDFRNFVNAVIDKSSFDKIKEYIEYCKSNSDAEIITGGKYNDSVGYFIEPTTVLVKDPFFKTMQEEIFGPLLTIYVYPDGKYEETLEICDRTSLYGLTGSIFAKDRLAVLKAQSILKNSAGNFYINDKPTGAVVGQQPFGGARGSGTNDKAGSYLNLLRWTSPRTVKETFISPNDFKYPFMRDEF